MFPLVLVLPSPPVPVTVPSSPITIDITVTFSFHSFFFQFSSKIQVFISLFCFPSVILCGQLKWQSSLFESFSCFYFFLTISWCGHLAKIRRSVCISKSQRIMCISHSRTDSDLCIYFFVRSNKKISQFPMDLIPHQVVSGHIPSSNWFTIFACYEINRFVSITT